MSTLNYQTEQKLETIFTSVSKTHGVSSCKQAFTVTPTMAQTLSDNTTHSVEFLKKINIFPVRDRVGEKVLMGLTGVASTRTDTSKGGKRKTRDILALKGIQYSLNKIDTDVHIPYRTLDAWSKLPDFEKRVFNHVHKQVGLDRLCYGWNGKSAEANTNPETNTKLEDLNPGWIQDVLSSHPENIIGSADLQITFGDAGVYKNLDHCVSDLYSAVPDVYRSEGEYVCLIGSHLLSWHDEQLYSLHSLKPSEKNIVPGSRKTFGGLPLEECPYFPVNGVVVCRLSDLSIYYQEDSWRRSMRNNAEIDAIESWNSRNEGAVVEEPAAFVALNPDFVTNPAV